MAEDKARDRRESLDSGRERNAVFPPLGPDVARMVFFNGLVERFRHSHANRQDRSRGRPL